MTPASESSGLDFKETELTLAPPGVTEPENGGKGTGKRGFSDTLDLNLSSGARPKDPAAEPSENRESASGNLPAAKAQVVGWPPVRSFRKNALKSSCKYVKVAVDGAPYLRKVDLEMYRGYQELLAALEEMFSCLTIRHSLRESKLMDSVDGTEYVPTYEDKDGDWMLVGDVPWKMFVESCKRLRLMKSSEAANLAPGTPERGGN